jgi:uncharacterized phage protein gp47/JayE
MDLPTRLDYYALGRAYLLSRAIKIDPGQVDVQGSDANIFVGSSSVLANAVTMQLAFGMNNLLLDGAAGDDLDRLSWDRYQLTRKGASPALGTVRFYRAVGGLAGTIPTGTMLQTLSGVQYITTQDAVFGVGDLQISVFVRAVQAGKITQVGANMIRSFQTPSAIFDQSIQLTNDLTTAGGEDAEDDETFRTRIRSFWTTARRGILAAIVQGATSVLGVVTATAIEALTSTAAPARVVNLYIADSSGVASAALAAQVVTALDDYRAAGIAVVVNTSIPLIINIQLALSFAANVDTVTLTSNILAAVVEFVNSLPVNGTLYISQLYAMLQRFSNDGLVVTQGTVVAPSGDLIPATNQTIRTTNTNVTVV